MNCTRIVLLRNINISYRQRFVNTILRFGDFTKRRNEATFALVIRKHFGEFSLVVTRDTIGKHVDDIALFCHIETRRFDAHRSVRACNIKFRDAMLIYECGKFLAREGVALCFNENIIRYDFEFRNQLCASSSALESPRAGGIRFFV